MRLFINAFRAPDAKDMLTLDLASAQRDLCMHKKLLEEQSAWVDMLDKRIGRIKQDLQGYLDPAATVKYQQLENDQ